MLTKIYTDILCCY